MVGREILGSAKKISVTGSTDTVDAQMYQAAMFVYPAGSGTMSESDSSSSGFTAVAAADLITEPHLPGTAWAIAYKGSKRYLRSSIACIAVLELGRHVPTYDSASSVTV